jgi:hypothetical protein
MRVRTAEEAITAWAALATAACFLPAIAVGAAYPPPTVDSTPKEIVHYLAAHRTTLLVVFYLTALGWGGFLLIFAAGLRAILRRAEGGSGVWSSVMFGACIATGVTILTAIVPLELVVYRRRCRHRDLAHGDNASLDRPRRTPSGRDPSFLGDVVGVGRGLGSIWRAAEPRPTLAYDMAGLRRDRSAARMTS